MLPPSNLEHAWIKFLTASDNSIIRDAGETLALMTGISSSAETNSSLLEHKRPEEWESALLVADCMKFSQSDDLVELSRIIWEWFSSMHDY